MQEMIISEEVKSAAEKNFRQYSRVTKAWMKAVDAALSLKRAEEKLELVKRAIPLEFENIKLLDIGSGFGLFVAACQNENIVCFGVEPDILSFEASIKLLKEKNLATSIRLEKGENLSYADNTFDLVVSFQVLEHVQEPGKVLKESIRVLKKGGYLYFVVPNYNSFWEGHYRLYWLPQFPKSIAKLYLKLLGRETKPLDSLNYITPHIS